ncbi:uncharacterized protein LOC131050758 [Cryptomeria japonica]|uniref:uncharacterized protein LOC131050758 n=1 Tax=Cryptomeria japonica TaxID=3369 RepID=UPI0025AD7254|nr:uncharacterized protein LOC131050758 [Cryptomeria japonica]
MEQIVKNREVVLASYANEGPVTDDHLKIRETQLNLNACKEGEVAVQNMWASVDPYLRWLMWESKTFSFDNFKLDQPIVSHMVGKVAVSANAAFKVGDVVTGLYEVSEYSIVGGSNLKKLDPNLVKPSDYFGPLGTHLPFHCN